MPIAEAIDQWFETFQNYEVTLVSAVATLWFNALLMVIQEEMAAASLDVNFKEELSAIEQCEYSHLWLVEALRFKWKCPLSESPCFHASLSLLSLAKV